MIHSYMINLENPTVYHSLPIKTLKQLKHAGRTVTNLAGAGGLSPKSTVNVPEKEPTIQVGRCQKLKVLFQQLYIVLLFFQDRLTPRYLPQSVGFDPFSKPTKQRTLQQSPLPVASVMCRIEVPPTMSIPGWQSTLALVCWLKTRNI